MKLQIWRYSVEMACVTRSFVPHLPISTLIRVFYAFFTSNHKISPCATSIFLWHIDSERHITQQVLQQDFTTTIDGLAFDATGTLLAMSLDSEIQILQVENGHLFVQLEGHQNKVTECIFHPLHPHVLLTTSEDRTFKVRPRHLIFICMSYLFT